MKKIVFYILALLFTICITSFSGCDNSVKYPPEVTTPSDDDSSSEMKTDQKTKEDSIKEALKDSLEKAQVIEAKELQDKLSVQGDSINDLNSRIDNLEKKSVGSLDKSSAYTFMIFEFIILSLMIIYLYLKLRKLDNRTQKIKLTLKDLSSSESGVSELQVLSIINKELKKMAEQITSVNLSQDKRMDDIVKRLIKLEGPQDAYYQYRPEQDQQEQKPRHEEPRKSEVFYMPRTMTEKQFEDSKKKHSKDDTTYFKFTIINSAKASFIFDPYDDRSIIVAYDNRDSSLLTVCDLEAKSTTPKSFRNIEPGEAELRGNVWVVTKKLKLQYV